VATEDSQCMLYRYRLAYYYNTIIAICNRWTIPLRVLHACASNFYRVDRKVGTQFNTRYISEPDSVTITT